MEHRWFNRSNINEEVQLFFRGRPLGSGELQNISRGGLCLKCHGKMPPVGAVITLNFSQPGLNAELPADRTSGLVVYIKENTLGLMFCGPQAVICSNADNEIIPQKLSASVADYKEYKRATSRRDFKKHQRRFEKILGFKNAG